MPKPHDGHGALQEAVNTLKAGHAKLSDKIDDLKEEIMEKDEKRGEKREVRDKEVDANFAKVNLRQWAWGIAGTLSPFFAGVILYPGKAGELLASIFKFFT